jgi:CRISPR type III-A-associated RAMP protein Csm4
LSLGIDDGCSFYKIEQRTNVTISRNTHDSVPYFNQILRFETDCGLWFICNENIEELLKSVGVGGIGGDKNNGLGKFEVEKIELSRDLKDLLETKTKYRMLISVVGPCEQDFSNDFSNSYYKLISRNSWKDNIKNDDINMFGEGSCFDFDLAGDIKDVRYIGCEHPIYKYGKSLSIALKIKGNLNGEGLYEIL